MIALIAGLGELVPIVGPFIPAIPAVLLASLDGSVIRGVQVAAFFVVLQQFENHVLMPYVMKKQAGVPRLLAVLALFAGTYPGGALWALIVIPFAGALRVLAVRVGTSLIRRWTGVGKGGGDESEPGRITRQQAHPSRNRRTTRGHKS